MNGQRTTVPRKSVLDKFVAMPRRAMADFMPTTRYKVLMAICIAVDNETGCSTISQKRISQRTGLHRNTVRNAIDDLERRGYVTRISRGRQTTGVGKGRFKTLMYHINYHHPDFDPAQRKLWPGGAQAGLCKPKHKPACSDSYNSLTNRTAGSLHAGSKARDRHGDPNGANPSHSDNAHPTIAGPKTNLAACDPCDQELAAISPMRLALALERTERREDLYNEAAITGVDIDLLTRLEKAHKAVSSVSSVDERVKISFEAERVPGGLVGQLRHLAETYEELLAARRSKDGLVKDGLP